MKGGFEALRQRGMATDEGKIGRKIVEGFRKQIKPREHDGVGG